VIPQQAQIQDLLNTIDEVLNKTSPRLPWVMTGDADQQRRVLEQTRRYLLALQQSESSSSGLASEAAPGIEGGGIEGGQSAGALQGYVPGYPQGYAASSAESAQQVLQAVLQEMSYLRTSVMQPMRSDLDLLYHQRESLMQEIKVLEAQRQQYTLSSASQQQMMSDFLQSLMGRLQENLTGQVAQMLSNLEAQSSRDRALMGSEVGAPPPTLLPAANSPTYQPVLTPTERLEQLQRVQSQSDQLLLRLDSTLRVIFESLQTNLQSYEDSLGVGLDKMHTLGQQGEAMFTALVNRLAQQLGREASNYLQSSLQDPNWTAPEPPVAEPGSGQTASPQPPANASAATGKTVTPAAHEPDPRTEIQTDEGANEALEDEIDLLLSELRGDTPPAHLSADIYAADVHAAGRSPDADVSEDQTANLSDLDRLNLEVDDLDLDLDAALTAARPLAGLDEELTLVQRNTADDDDDDLTFFQVNEELTQFQLDDDESADDFAQLLAPPLVDNLDSALDLLNQISTGSADLQTNPAETDPAETNPAENDALAAASAPPTPGDRPSKMAFSAAADIPYEDLDEFYESLFGASAITVDENWAEAPVDRHVAAASDPVLDQASDPAALNPAALDLDLLADLDAQLFDGLSDPALDAAEEPSVSASELFGGFSSESLDPLDPMGEIGGRSPQAIEHLLFGEPLFSEAIDIPSGDDDDETALLNPPPASTAHAAALDASETIETIGSLTASWDLIDPLPDLPATTNQVGADRQHAADRVDALGQPHQDSYEAAAVDEDLLTAAESYDESRLDFEVEAETLEQLSADLFALERSDGASPVSLPTVDVAPPASPQPLNEFDLTFPLNEPDFTTQQRLGESLEEAMNQDLTLPIAPDQIVLSEADEDDEVDAVYRFLETSQPSVEPLVTSPELALFEQDLADDDPTMPLLYPTPVYSLPLDNYAPPRSPAEWVDPDLDNPELTNPELTNPEPKNPGLFASLADTALPPGREDLSLSDYQTLMLMSSGDSENTSENTSEDTMELGDLFADELFGDVVTHAGGQPETTPSPTPEPEPNDSVFLADLFADVPSDLTATESPLTASDDAFTLDGLGNLFEDLPSIEPATPILPPSSNLPSAGASATALPEAADDDFTLDNWPETEPEGPMSMANDWEVALTSGESNLDAKVDLENAKKKTRSRHVREFGFYLKPRQ